MKRFAWDAFKIFCTLFGVFLVAAGVASMIAGLAMLLLSETVTIVLGTASFMCVLVAFGLAWAINDDL